MNPAESEEGRRRRRRALLRTHHPDRGGDQAEFVSVLKRLDEELLYGTGNPEMRFTRRRRWWQRTLSRPSRCRGSRSKRVI